MENGNNGHDINVERIDASKYRDSQAEDCTDRQTDRQVDKERGIGKRVNR